MTRMKPGPSRRDAWRLLSIAPMAMAVIAAGSAGFDETRLPASDRAATALAAATGTGRAIIVAVAPNGDDAADGSASRPFHTLARTQQAVRQLAVDHDVTVELADGVYRLDAPLAFGPADGGHDGHQIVWTAAAGARPVISGGLAVTGWTPLAGRPGVFVADVPKGIESRQLFVDGVSAARARIEVARSDVAFTQAGIALLTSGLAKLALLQDQTRIEVEGTGFFTDRFSPVARITSKMIAMQQPAWNNNIWGYDTLANPYEPRFAHLYLVNALAFLTEPGQWYLDPHLGKLYYKPAAGVAIDRLAIELPRLPYLIGIAGTYRPVADLSFRGLRFFHTSWLGPLAATGYANQQSGTFLAETSPAYPTDSLKSCRWGCPAFETMRNEWHQMPAAIQVAGATRVRFERNVFAHLGQVALGIGNDTTANASGIGLGASDIAVTANLFTDLAGGAIVVGGVRRDAHHPSDPRLINRDIRIANNRITAVSRDFRDNAAILSTYVDGARIVHNDVSDAPYDGIDIGFGWGIQDAGGNANYREHMHGYDHAANIVYTVPTTLRHTIVANNRVHDVKRHYEDGGAIYNLSANPGALIVDNYVFDLHGHIGLYLDEGSQDVTLRGNVVDGNGKWLNDNTISPAFPMRITIDNRAVGNWHNSAFVGGRWNVYQNDLILDDHPVDGQNWPAAAGRVIDEAGIEAGSDVPTLD